MTGQRYCPKCGSEVFKVAPVTLVPDAKRDWNLCSECNCVFTVRGPRETVHGYLEGNQWTPRIIPPYEKYMTVRWLDDLYLMQNEHGLIKIGRSIDPHKRLKALQKAGQCRIDMVLVIPEKGHREEAVHRRLKKFRMAGEWFEGGERAYAAVGAAIKAAAGLKWPFEFDQQAADQWLDRFHEKAALRYDRQQLQDLLRGLRETVAPDRSLDASIWRVLMFSSTSDYGLVTITYQNGEMVPLGYMGENEAEIVVPSYTADLCAAMTLWPAASPPDAWKGSAIECCIAALEERKRILFPRRKSSAQI